MTVPFVVELGRDGGCVWCQVLWRELMERDNRDDVDEAWTAFRKQLELGREIEVVDENGDRIEYGDYPDEEDPEYD